MCCQLLVLQTMSQRGLSIWKVQCRVVVQCAVINSIRDVVKDRVKYLKGAARSSSIVCCHLLIL